MTKLQIPLFLTRLSITVFLLPWVLMRFTKPESAKYIAGNYYKVSNLPDLAITAVGIFWVILLLAFVLGFKKRISYGLVFLFHTVGTIFTIPNLIPGTEGYQILFFAAIPTAMAMLLLYQLRDQDTFLAIGK